MKTQAATGAGPCTSAPGTRGAGPQEQQAIGYEEFRSIMGSFASGISVVSTLDQEDRPHGLTCSAVCSVSADPPLLLACVRTPSRTLDIIRERGRFTVNFLDAQAREVSDLFASLTADKFADVRWWPGKVAGMPVLDRALAHAECLVHQFVDAGDHVIVLGRLIGGEVDTDRYPLGYWRGSYVRMTRLVTLP